MMARTSNGADPQPASDDDERRRKRGKSPRTVRISRDEYERLRCAAGLAETLAALIRQVVGGG